MKAQALSKQLPQLDFTQNTDVDALETSNWMMGTKVIKKNVAKVEPSPGSKPGWDTYLFLIVLIKVKFILQHDVKAQRGTRGIFHLFL